MAQPFHVIDVERGDYSDRRIDDVDGVEPPAHAHFQNHKFKARAGKNHQRGQRAELKERERGVRAGSLHLLEGRADGVVIHRHPVQLDALVVAEQMRRGVGPDPIARQPVDRVEHRDRRALAVGAGDGDNGGGG